MSPFELTLGDRAVSARRHPGAAPTLVFCHGAGGNERSFDELLAELPTSRAFLVPSLPGRLGSEGPPLGSVAEMVRFVLAAAAAAGVEAPLFVGHSLGGAVALEAALQAPERVAGLALFATGARLRVHPTILEAHAHAAERGERVPLTLAWRADTDAGLVARCEARRAETPPETTLADWRAADGFDRMDALAEVRAPALLVGGEEDALTPPKYMQYLDRHLAESELHLLPRAGHMLPHERAAEVAELLERFASGLPKPG